MPITGDNAATAQPLRASLQDGSYPRPQMVRESWADLSGQWRFRYDDNDRGLGECWYLDPQFDREIIVPFPPESPASGIGDTGFHRVVWYHRELAAPDFRAAGVGAQGDRVILHFGAVDYRASVWLNGQLLGRHEGGHTPFQFDVTSALDEKRMTQTLVLRAEDDPHDVMQPRGKQDWLLKPHAVWYDRTTGIWQPVWLEAVPAVAIDSLQWIADVAGCTVRALVRLSGRPAPGCEMTIRLSFDGELIASRTATPSSDRFELTIELPTQANGQAHEHLLWTPEHPRLLDASITFTSGALSDTVQSYLGLRSVGAEHGVFVLNDRPYYVRSVLSQGFWPESHLASPTTDALRAEAQLIKDLGFNATRVHQKIEDPRFLYWTDRLGILVWEEMPSALEFGAIAIQRVTAEWTEAIERDLSHPSIVAWVPLNESWGVQHIATNVSMKKYATALFHLTKALDSTRSVISNDGWEQTESDIWTIHDYESNPNLMQARYADAAARATLFTGFGPAGRRLRVSNEPERGQPVMLTEFGGIRFTPDDATSDVWGYSSAIGAEDFRERLHALFGAVVGSDFLAGYCYTQLTDTQQEANGLTDAHRLPKLPITVIADIVRSTD